MTLLAKSWAHQGLGLPRVILVFYLLKMLVYVWVWTRFCRFIPGLVATPSVGTIGDFWLHPLAFQKAVLWSIMFESLGLGCASGPLSGRNWPLFGLHIHALWPGSYKYPLFYPVLGNKRGLLDVTLYFLLQASLLRALLSPAHSLELLIPVVALLVVAGVLDKTIMLAARGEHYWSMTMCIVLSLLTGGNDDVWVAGCKIVQCSLWFWAGASKLNPHFAYAVMNMTTNHPFMPKFVRRAVVRGENDIRPSLVCKLLAHGALLFEVGTALAFNFLPDVATVPTAVLTVVFHTHILLNVPAAVPLEWNLMVMYGVRFLFVQYQHVVPCVVLPQHPGLAVFVALMGFLIPLVGNLKPGWVSFLFAMRYYAGNWCWSLFVFDDYAHVIEIGKRAKTVFAFDAQKQIEDMGTTPEVALMLGNIGTVVGALHLNMRWLQLVIPKHIPEEKLKMSTPVLDGMLVGGLLGWSFGDAHLAQHALYDALQELMQFKAGQCLVFHGEGQPLFGNTHHYQVFDLGKSTSVPLEEGDIPTAKLLSLQPWGPTKAD